MPDNPYAKALEGLDDGAQAPAISPTTAPRPTGRNPYAQEIQGIELDESLRKNPTAIEHLKNFFKFTGHGTTRGLTEFLGMPVDDFNAASEFVRNYPALGTAAAVLPMIGPEVAAARAYNAVGGSRIETGTGDQFRKGAESIGLPTSTPEQEGVKDAAADWGDTLGEFGGANLPFVLGAPEKIAVQAGKKTLEKTVPNIMRIMKSESPTKALLHDVVFGGLAPGSGAVLGQEIAGPENKDAGKSIGAVAGGLRSTALHGVAYGAKQGYSWLHDFLGLGTGAKGKVGRSLADAATDIKEARKNVRASKPAVSPGAKIPVDIRAQDEGLIGLRRTVMAKDAELHGDYRGMQLATQRALEEDTKLSQANFPDTQVWLDTKQALLERLSNQRLQQAVEEAEHNVETTFRGTLPNAVDANVYKAALATSVKQQLALARDDMDAVVASKWEKVDKSIPVDKEMYALYDAIATMKAEHASRPGQSDERFPSKIIKRFFATEEDENGKLIEVPKFGAGSTLQDAIDASSELSQDIRVETAKDAPDRVYLSYLTRLSDAVRKVKENAPGADTNAFLKDANSATKLFHDTFSRGPVGQLFGHDVPGAPDVFPGDTVRHFLSQGPGGVDNFQAFVQAAQQRSQGQDLPELMNRYLRQDFYDTAMPNGQFNPAAAKRWMKNNSGPLGHPGYEPLRKEFEGVIDSNGQAVAAKDVNKQELDQIRSNRAHTFLNGKPGPLFNGAINAADKYTAMRDLINMTLDDPTGRATEGLAQMALDHMLASATAVDRTSPSLQRIDGTRILDWVQENKKAVQALDEAIPGVKSRFDRIATTAKYLEGFHVNPDKATAAATEGMMLTDLMAQVMGARAGAKVGGHVAGSIQTASLGSKAARALVRNLKPDQAAALFRKAMVDRQLFRVLTEPTTAKNANEQFRTLQPYVYSTLIPIMQPTYQQPQDQK